MDVAAKQKVLLKNLRLQIKKLQDKEDASRAKMRAALNKINSIGRTYKVRLARKMREMERKLANTEAACYARIALDLENQLVKGIRSKVRALTAAAKRAKRPTAKRSSVKPPKAGRSAQKKV